MRIIKEFKIDKNFEITGIYTIFQQRFDSNFFFDGETHDFWELVCVLDGEVGITAGKYVYSLKDGECFLHRPLEFHRIWAENSTAPEIAVFTFSGKNALKSEYGIYSLGGALSERVKRLVQKSDMIFEKQKEGEIVKIKENYEFEADIFINELENLMLRIFAIGDTKKNVIGFGSAEKYTAAIRIMEENIDKRLDAEAIARLCGTSLPNLKKIFKKYSGGGVMEYFGNMKINTAKQYLREGKSVKETSYMLGFYDQNYFNVFFKRHTGISPGKYR